MLLPLLLAACGPASTISPDTTPQPASVSPSACSLVPQSAVASAVAIPSATELTPGAPTPFAKDVSTVTQPPPGVYAVSTVVNHPNVGQCTYQSVNGPELVVNVFPKATLTSLPDLTVGLKPLGPAMVSSTDDAGLIAFQDQGAVIGITLQVGGLNQSALARRMGAVVEAVTGEQLPLPGLNFGAPSSTGKAVPTPLPAAGQQVNGQTAAETVQQTNQLSFDPASVTVSLNGVVEWTNTSGVPHNVTFDANPELTSQTMNPGDKYEVKFTRAGQYPYHCTFHPGMNGTVTVS